MKELTNSIGTERDDIVNNWYPTRETSAVMRLLQAIVAHEDDDKDEDPDSYWHP